MGENDTINDQVLIIHSSNNRKLKIKAVRNTDNCFTISQYKTEEPEKYGDINPYLFRGLTVLL